VFVLVDDAGEAVTSPDVESGEVARICDRIRERAGTVALSDPE
jgi:hypothetical protein